MSNIAEFSIILGSCALAIVFPLLSGCDNNNNNDKIDKPRSVGKYSSRDIEVYCDKLTGVEYLVNTKYRAGGITVRLDRNMKPRTCPKG